MSVLIQSAWARQPQIATRINSACPLARGLVGLWPGSVQNSATTLRDLAGRNAPTLAGSAARRASPAGLGVYLDGSAGTWLDFGSSAALKSSEFTWTATVIPNSLTNAYTAVFSCIESNANNYYQLLLKSSGKLAAYLYRIGGSPSYYDGDGYFTLTTGRAYRLSLSVSSTSLAVYVDGRVDGSVSLAAGSFSGSNSVYIGEDSYTPGRRLTGHVSNISYHNRELKAYEQASFFRDQWQLYAPAKRWLLPTQSVGYTHPTLSNARMGSLISTGGVPLVDYAF